MGEHFDIYCREHEVRIGGCRCIGENKTKRYQDCPGESCPGETVMMYVDCSCGQRHDIKRWMLPKGMSYE